ncbi:putative iron-sulfur cluster-binding metallochaperone [Paenibacillus thiaminolyticus]|uniref:(2Fe-2S)-binding protein n=1 Tax=Paenibacillus thiaminolyticus TaxID=49283 RepID=A0A3A3GFU4_PANTH|nr:(2Fe-2S)-binding protein [Paenibacillus thiaminolyticus]RJG22480.1 (2Fe-2S)-binding protein [Paenibacillus thiaminolyticus]
MDCCASSNNTGVIKIRECPSCGEKGKNVQIITLKSLLKALALETIESENSYAFCSNPACSIVYFSGNHSQTFMENDLKVPVYQKNPSTNVPVCYCFDWTKDRLQAAGTDQRPADEIKAHVQAGSCGCEVNNPQGACCLGNVSAFVRGLKKG